MKRIAKGSKIQMDIGSAWTTISHVDRFSGPDAEGQDVETPTLDQSGNGIPHDYTGYTQPGGMDFDYYFDPDLAVHQELTDELANPTQGGRDFRIVWSDGTTWPLTALVKKATPSGNVGEFLRGAGGLQLTDLCDYPS